MTARQPPEWAPHDWVWIGFPSHEDLWEGDLGPAREEVIDFARAIHADGAGEEVRLVAADARTAGLAREMAGPGIHVMVEPFGDIWLRDTGPIVIKGVEGRWARSFRFNGWGGKYDLEGDDSIGLRLSAECGLLCRRCDWILEGGAVDVDGTGLLVTTEQCLLNPNRNPDLSREQVEELLRQDLGAERILWLGEGLLNDHTDGHVDNIARFVAEGTLAIPVPTGIDDPNHQVYTDARYRAEAFGLAVVPVPSPGRVERDGEIAAASYMNFYIGNAAVVLPVYGAANDESAVAVIGGLFPDRRTVGLRADHVLTGGGSFHCITQQVPR